MWLFSLGCPGNGRKVSRRSGEDPGKTDVTRRSSPPPITNIQTAAFRAGLDWTGGRDGVICERWMWLRDRLQTEEDSRCITSNWRAHTGPAEADCPAQKADAHVQAEWLRFRGRFGMLTSFIPGSDTCFPAPHSFIRRASCRAAVHLVPPVRWHRVQDPEGERGAVSSLQKLGSPATSRLLDTLYNVRPGRWNITTYLLETTEYRNMKICILLIFAWISLPDLLLIVSHPDKLSCHLK